MSYESQGWPTEQVVPLLQEVELFDGLPDEDLRRIAGIVKGMELDSGETLFEEGEAGDAFYIVFRGAIEIAKARSDGRVEKLAVRRAGQAFGEMALLNDAPRSATARAVESTRLMVVDQDAFKTLLGGDSLALRMMRVLSKALRALDIRFASVEDGAVQGSSFRDRANEVSRFMQSGLLPATAPALPGFDLAAGTTTEDTGRGGSVWDWMELSDGGLALLTMDVRNEGFPPAHHLGVVRGVMRAVVDHASGVKELLAAANDAVVAAGVEGLNQHVEVGLLVVSGSGLEWGSAGRVPGGIIRRDGAFESFGAHGPPLGMMEDFRYQSQTFQVGAGDTLFVLSHASKGLFLGAADLLAQLHGKPSGEVVSTLHQAIRAAQGDQRTATSVVYARKH